MIAVARSHHKKSHHNGVVKFISKTAPLGSTVLGTALGLWAMHQGWIGQRNRTYRSRW